MSRLKVIWKELKKLSDSIFDSTTPKTMGRIGLFHAESGRCAWRREVDDQTVAVWQGTRVKIRNRFLGQLYLPEFVRVDPLSEGISSKDGSSEIFDSMLAKEYRYSPSLRWLSTHLLSVQDVRYPEAVPKASMQDINESLKFGKDAVTKDDYDFLISELGRGTSGASALSNDVFEQ